MHLHLLDAERAHATGALCLDGTVPGFYFEQGSAVDAFVIELEGGGWCYTVEQCYYRASSTSYGSSKSWENEIEGRGPISGDESINPTFASYNRVYVKYCDAGSFHGSSKPVAHKDMTLHFAGKRILELVIKTLSDDFGMASAKNVLLTGCSAGGLAAILNADYVHSLLPSTVTRYRVMPGSGFFLQHPNIYGQRIYENNMKEVIRMHGMVEEAMKQASGAGSKGKKRVHSSDFIGRGGCMQDHAPNERHQCFFAATALRYTQAPVFIIDSAMDAWQLGCILHASPITPSDAYVDYMSQCYTAAAKGSAGGVRGTANDFTSCVHRAPTPLDNMRRIAPQGCNEQSLTMFNNYRQQFLLDLAGMDTTGQTDQW
jgi:hypothetical protein